VVELEEFGELDDEPAYEIDDAADHSAPQPVAVDTEALDLGFDFQPDELDAAVGHSGPVAEDIALEGPMAGVESGAVPPTSNVADDIVEAVEESISDAAQALGSEPEHPEASGSMNLLDEILADDSFDVEKDQQRQVETIAQEMEGQIAGDVAPDDFGGQYELGVVYMDMGLFDNAIAAFDAAARGDDYRLGALEMRGTCLLRLGRDRDAMAAFEEGLAIEGAPEQAYLGLLYGVGCCHELRDEVDQALDYFQRVADVDERFLDVTRRLEQLTNPG
jgi:tetratricopeptide (TPR) repeat protein